MRNPGRSRWVGLAWLALSWASVAPAADTVRKPAEASKSARDARALALKIDRLLAEKWAEAKVVPVGPADDAEYLRRLSLDLVGKLPTASEARDFLDDPAPDKRARLVERLLDSPTYTARATDLWRQLLLPEADTEGQARFAAPAFEAWLRKKVLEDVGYDQMVREILTAKLGARAAASPTNTKNEPSPAAFYIAKEGKPENLAAGASRVFLGVRLECAQCHNHPFAKWKREEFWGLAAFFAGVKKDGPDDGYGAIREVANRRELAIPGTEKIIKAAFLDGPSITWKAKAEPREVLADWVTSPKNPYFARAAVNRAWARFFGTGIVDPVDDMGGENTPSHPELLDELAGQFAGHNFELKFLIRAITATRAYGLTSALDRPEPTPPYLFSAMAVRGLSAGQLFSSLAQATGFREGPDNYMMDAGGARGRFIDLFANRDEKPTEAQTSILQALTLMNGQIVAGATSLESGDTLAAVAEAPYLDTAGRVEELFLAALTRRPRPDESTLLVDYIEKARTPEGRSGALADVFWAILNGPEFKHNH
jgi:Protein of unknown function (DUF1549)/Protein of unknown function (DUF1553)